MTGGWQAQLERTQRWYARALKARNPTDRWDYLYAFFENALHLRDWLLATGAATESELNAFVASNPDLRICRDLANAHKHHSLRGSKRSPAPSEVREYTPKGGNLDSTISLIVVTGGEKYDGFALAARILRAWNDFIDAHVP